MSCESSSYLFPYSFGIQFPIFIYASPVGFRSDPFHALFLKEDRLIYTPTHVVCFQVPGPLSLPSMAPLPLPFFFDGAAPPPFFAFKLPLLDRQGIPSSCLQSFICLVSAPQLEQNQFFLKKVILPVFSPFFLDDL